MSHETPNSQQSPDTIYARPEMRSNDPRDRGHVVGGWKLVGTSEGTVLQHDQYKDVPITNEDYPELERLQGAMGHLAVDRLGPEGQPLPKVSLSDEEKDSQGRPYVDAAILADKRGKVRVARNRVRTELKTLDATKPIPVANEYDAQINRGGGIYVSPAESSRLNEKAARDAARRA